MSDSTYDIGQVISDVSAMANQYGPARGAITNLVEASSSPAIALSFNFSRKSFMLWNSDAQIYVKLGSNISSTSFSFVLNAGKFFAMDNYGGAVMIQAVGSNSNVLVTELN